MLMALPNLAHKNITENIIEKVTINIMSILHSILIVFKVSPLSNTIISKKIKNISILLTFLILYATLFLVFFRRCFMSKININSKIKSSDGTHIIKDKHAILKDGSIYYKYDNVNNVITIKDNKVSIKRENDEYNMILIFDNNKSIASEYAFKDINISMQVKTKTHKLKINDNNLLIEYTVYINDVKSDDFIYELEWREL